MDDISSQWQTDWRLVQQRWQETCASWQDSQRARFEREIWLRLEIEVAGTQRQLERLSKVIKSARRSLGAR